MLYEEYLKLNSLHLFLFTKKIENLTEFVLLNCTFWNGFCIEFDADFNAKFYRSCFLCNN